MKKHLLNKGFVLTEILITVSVFLIICVPAVDLLLRAREYTKYSNEISKSSFLAQSIMEYLKCEDEQKLQNTLNKGANPTVLYYIFKNDDHFDINNYVKQSSLDLEETFDDMLKKLSLKTNDNGYDYILKIVLSKDEQYDVYFVNVVVLSRELHGKYSANLISLRR